MDNCFTSPQRLEALLHQKTYGCGTVRLALKDMPEVFHGQNKKEGKERTAVYQRGNLVPTVWHDKRPVAILSSDVSPEVRRHTKEPPYQKVVKVPTHVHDYNMYMRGVDLSDQLRGYYPPGRTAKKWWKYLFWYCLDTCICNAYLLGSKHLPADKSDKWRKERLLGFSIELGKELIGGFSSRQCQQGPNIKSRKWSSMADTTVTVEHRRVQFEGRKRVCVGCKRRAPGEASQRWSRQVGYRDHIRLRNVHRKLLFGLFPSSPYAQHWSRWTIVAMACWLIVTCSSFKLFSFC